MDILSGLLQIVGPTLVGLATVPVLGIIKRIVTFVDGLAAPFQQILAVLIAFGLTQLGALANTALPETLSLFTGSEIEALLSAAIAFGVHAGGKAKR